MPDDRTIRDNVVAALERFSRVYAGLINVVVLDGIVQLWGVLTNESQRDRILTAADGIPGVISVEDHLMLVQPPAFGPVVS